MMIWCVEDDKSILDIEIYTLKSMGFEAVGFVCGEEFFKALENDTPDLILLDIMLPDIDGVEILKRLKEMSSTEKIPVIMATAKGTEYDKVQSLDIGADDYLVKPFGMMEMVSRVKAVLRRCKPYSNIDGNDNKNILKYDTLEMDTNQHTVTVDKKRISLTYKEYELLRLFLENIGIVFTRDNLFSKIWGEKFIGETRTIDVHVRSLRHKIGKYGKRIETVRNIGYRMEAAI